MKFDMKSCLQSFSLALDFAEMDYLKINSNHSRRVTYIVMMIADTINLSIEDKSDLGALSLLHDNGIVLSATQNCGRLFELLPDHCIEGEKNITKLPLYSKHKDIITYHHENFDGTGFFQKRADEIPLFSQIIHIADCLDVKFNLNKLNHNDRNKIHDYLKENTGILFNPEIITSFEPLMNKERFWADLHFYNIDEVLNRVLPDMTFDFTWADIVKISEVFMDIIDSKSHFTRRHSKGLTEKILIMADYYNFDLDKTNQLNIAANLHDIGKLFVPNDILEKPDKLNDNEFQVIKQHTYFTKLALDKIKGFEDISKWASNHHEKLNGKGYPESYSGKDLDFESRLMTILDIYQALTEDRPYRVGMSHDKAVSILKNMANENYIDENILSDVEKVMNKKI